jgi:nicotinate-nucleotide adenylyltransferase
MSRRIAIYGGSFDPPHLGHVLVTAWALSACAFDAVWVFPVFKHRFDKQVSDFESRLALCRLAFAVFGAQVEVRDDERCLVQAGGSGATVELIEHLLATNAAAQGDAWQPQLLIGSDQVDKLNLWHRADELLALAPPVIVARQGTGTGAAADIVIPNISSTAVRAALATGAVPRAWLPAAVADALALQMGRHGN